MWTRFMDMHSGGGTKTDWEYIYIESDEAEARVVFYNRFGSSPDRVTCTCCGEDFYVREEGDFDPLSVKGMKDVLVIRADEIKPEEREGTVPDQGYVWMD